MNFDWDDVVDGLDTALDVGKTVAAGSPVGAGLSVVDAVVESRTKGVGINDDEVIQYLETLAKSTHNNVDDRLLCMVKSYLQCEAENG